MPDASRRRVLVTGGSGMVGTAIAACVRSERADWFFATRGDGDLCSAAETDALFCRVRPTHVVHLAARVGGLFCNMDNMADMCHENLAININVLHAAHEHGVAKVVSCLSTCIFPDKTEYPITEAMIHDGPPHHSNFGYAYAKRMIDVLNRSYNQQHGSIFTSVIPTNIFGPGDNFNAKDAHVIPALIRKFCDAVDHNASCVTLAGTGLARRQFIYAPDLAKLIVWVLDNYNSVDPIILSVPESAEMTIADAAATIAKAAGYSGLIEYDSSLPDGQIRKTASATKLQKMLPNFNFTPFHEAVAETVKWYRSNKGTART